MAERFHPGEYVRDELKARGMTVVMFRRKMGWYMDQQQRAERLLAETLDVDEDVAERLARTFGTSTTIWLRLQAAWDEGEVSG